MRWSIDLPTGLLVFALTIIMAGILIGPAMAGIVVLIEAVTLVILGVLQSNGGMSPNLIWRSEHIALADVIEFVILLGILSLISWLSNYELEKSLRRARASEAALAEEREGLEIKVAERTKQIERIQMERMLEVQQFAEFGRFSAGLMHDFANPLTVATLEAEELGRHQQSKNLAQIQASLQHLERYVDAARKQIQRQSIFRNFDPAAEVEHVIAIVGHTARTAGAVIEFRPTIRHTLYGDPVKFNQLVANLLNNAIDAYHGLHRSTNKPHRILIKLTQQRPGTKLAVHDWGRGIKAVDIEHVFKPFYTTKSQTGRGAGIGLALVKGIVEDSFNGELSVTSSPDAGTVFTAHLFDGRDDDAS